MKKIFFASALVLILLITSVLASSCAASTQQSVIIPATGSTYIVTDASTTDDPQGLRDKNYSTQNYINIWYQWDVQATEKDISVGLVKFDISSLKNKDIKSATLQMYVTSSTLTQAARLVDISLVDTTWNEQKVTYNNKPTWETNASSSAAVFNNGAGIWTSWDVTGEVAQKPKGGVVSYAIGLDAMTDKSQEQVTFASRQVSDTSPRLIVTYTLSNNSPFAWWVWVVGIVVIAIIAFFAGWMITRRRISRRAATSGEAAANTEVTGDKPPEQ
jgi:hypothetical protein